MTADDNHVVVGSRPADLLRRGLRLEYVTLTWNVVGIVILGYSAITARSVALGGFGLDSLIEIGASTVVIWDLKGTDESRQHRALRLIGVAFVLLALYLAVQGSVVLASGHRAEHSLLGIIWTAITAVAMFLCSPSGRPGPGRLLATRCFGPKAG